MSTKSKLIQRMKICLYLQEHGSATVRDLVLDLNINSPTKRISELIRMEYPIYKKWENHLNSYGEHVRYMRYYWGGWPDGDA